MPSVGKVPINKALSYTSIGSKYVFHPQQIENFLNKNGNTVISASMAPTNECNLHCSYCNQDNRNKRASLSMDTIKEFVTNLQKRGLKAVVVTGGGEPTRYREFNELAKWLKEIGLLTALLTNGTNDNCGDKKVDTWDTFEWIRVSLNFDKNGKLREIKVPKELNKGNVGMSMVYLNQTMDMLKEVEMQADKYNARFVRLIPDTCLPQDQAMAARDNLDEMVDKLGNKRFYVQKKGLSPAKLEQCHQSRLRPFLLADGSVAPCDCFMLNKDENGEYYKTLPESFNLSPTKGNPMGYFDFLDDKFQPRFNPKETCKNCSFTDGNQILEDLIKLREEYPKETVQELFARIGQFPSSEIGDINFI